MKQLLQSLKNGETYVREVPAPKLTEGGVIIQSSKTLVSAGTERMLVDFGRGSLIKKARSQPDKVKAVIDKIKVDGLSATYEAVHAKLDQPIALGYCNVGTIIESAVDGLDVGTRIVSNGPHAEIVSVKKNLCAIIPDTVSNEQAAFTVLGSIGLQGIRLAAPSLGEYFVVMGLGMIGLLTVQMLHANGCRVLAVDYDYHKLELARSFGAETFHLASETNILVAADNFSKGDGVDAVIITAATKSNQPISDAAKICRKRGRIILVGVAGLEINRADFYEKEISFQVSCSYGPGRYDDVYENMGIDYPMGYVRWTENRNFQAVLEMMEKGQLNVDDLITHKFKIDDAIEAINVLHNDPKSIGILIDYDQLKPFENLNRTVKISENPKLKRDKGIIGIIGSGNYASRILIPAFTRTSSILHTLVSEGGVSAVHNARKFGIGNASSDYHDVIQSREIDTLVIATRHNQHAAQVLMGLDAGKHIFCEKPLCTNLSELQDIRLASVKKPELLLMVGFNRRFAPHIVKIKELLRTNLEPIVVNITINAGQIPISHWTQNPEIGGGRLIGEACHFIDLCRYIVASPIVSHSVVKASKDGLARRDSGDTFILTLKFEDGSIGSINYLANGDKSFPKERVEVFTAGKVLSLDNYRVLKGWGWTHFKSMRLFKQDKGQNSCVASFVQAIQNGSKSPIPLDEVLEISRVTIEAANNLK